MVDCKPAPTPFLSGVKLEASCSSPLADSTLYCQLVGSLIYWTHTRLDISDAVGLVSRFMQEPHELHWKATKRILHYVHGTHSYGIHYTSCMDIELVGYTDSDWVGDSQDHEYTLGYCFSLGSGPIAWSSKKQSFIALSSTKAEYQGVVDAATKAIWLQNILIEFGISFRKPTVIFCDNQSAIQISCNQVHHQQTKHIEIHMHYI
ncbi:secreted RxLR effector protein 161-like [Cryptomeria japonica]|uniref:secreted RxLR effector protein 161-like n=1 Tax=Cryptomeria japonica TaxID=3369 RepID=UPI0027DA5105|nr:secreted RxLR effector protein 161-like [Cryptomeria japonica]